MNFLDYQLKRSARRKTLAIKVADLKVTVYAPVYVPEPVIGSWVRSKKNWIDTQLQRQQDESGKRQSPMKRGKLRLFDSEIKLEVTRGNKTELIENNGVLCLTLSNRICDENKAAKKLIDLYLKEQLSQYLGERLLFWQRQMKLNASSLNVRFYKRRWGSCTSKGVLSFNLLLAGAPYPIIDYVIVHELAHLRHLNHSNAFWRLVEAHYPNYRDAERWLKFNGKYLEIAY